MIKYFLLERNIDINAEDINGGSSGLRLASSNGYLDLVIYLLTNNELTIKANYQLSDKHSSFPAFRMACNKSHYSIVEYFMENNYKIDDKLIKKVIKNAFLENYAKILNLLIIKYKIPLTKEINDYIEKYECYELKKYFNKINK